LANEIRDFTVRQYITPAREEGKKLVQIRVGDVHSAMKLRSRCPAVAGAIGSIKFEAMAKVILRSREGPHMGANLVFTFEILERP
jgi:hypothetical protein